MKQGTLQVGNIYLGDCLELMPLIPSKSIDMILCDLPYGTTACKWDTVIPFEPLWKEYKRLIKDRGAIVLFGSEPFSSYLRISNIDWYKYDWVWEKTNPSNIALANKQPMKYHEAISVFCNGSTYYYKQMIKRINRTMESAKRRGYVFHNSGSDQTGLKYVEVSSDKYDADWKNPSTILKFNSLRPNAKEFAKHPTQKPVALCEYLIRTYTNEGDTVLDNCMGSGTTGVACRNLNRNFVGIEKEPEYFEIAKQRIENPDYVKPTKAKAKNKNQGFFSEEEIFDLQPN